MRCTAAITGDTHRGDWDGTVERREVKERNGRTIRIWKRGERRRIECIGEQRERSAVGDIQVNRRQGLWERNGS